MGITRLGKTEGVSQMQCSGDPCAHKRTFEGGNNRSWQQKEQLLSKVRLQIKKTF